MKATPFHAGHPLCPVRSSCPSTRAFSLVQLMAVMAIGGILTAMTVNHFAGSRDSIATNKLESDVRSLNTAIQIYRTFGGNLDSASTAEDVLRKLQSQADSVSARQTAGLTGSLIDRRLRTQPLADGDSSQPRAVWDAAKQKFVMATSGGDGVARFILDESRAAEPVEEEARVQNLQLANASTWIWDYNDSNAASSTSPTSILPGGADEGGPTGGGSGGGGPGGPPGPDPTNTLQPPDFSIPGGTYLITGYDLGITLSNPNPLGSSRIIYRLGAVGEWLPYLGSTLSVAPGMEIHAMAESILPEDWSNSATREEAYAAGPLNLITPVITTSAFAFDYGANQTVLVTLNDLNDPIYSTLQYRIGGGSWQQYAGAFNLNHLDFPYPAGATIEARAVATPPVYPDYYYDSEVASAYIEPSAVPLGAPGIELSAERFGPKLGGNQAGDCPSDGLLAEFSLENGNFQFTRGATSGSITITETAWKGGNSNRPYEVTFSSLVPVDQVVVKSGWGLQHISTYDYPEPVFDGALTGPGDRKIRVIEFRCSGSFVDADINSGVDEIEVTLTDANPTGTANIRYTLVARSDGYADTYQTLPAGEDTSLYQLYTGPFTVDRDEFPEGFGVKAFAESTGSSYLDSDVAYNQTMETPLITISGTALGNFHNAVGGDGMVTNLEEDESNNVFEWGNPVSGYDTPSWLEFNGSAFNNVSDGDLFYLGSINYFNGTIYTGSGADSVNLALTLDFNGNQSHTFDFALDLINTPNNTGTQEGDADYVKLQDLASFTPTTIYGWTFNLMIEFGDVGANGFSTIDEFHTFEEATAFGHLFGTLNYVGE